MPVWSWSPEASVSSVCVAAAAAEDVPSWVGSVVLVVVLTGLAWWLVRGGIERMTMDTGIPLKQIDLDNAILVWADRTNYPEAWTRLHQIYREMKRVVEYLVEHRLPTRERAALLETRFAELTLRELNPGHDTIGYTYWKNVMDICLRNPKDVETFDDMNNSMFVALHELAHVMSDGMGHDDTFWEHFRIILRAAVELKVYRAVLYDAEPQRHCGYLIQSTPISKELRA